MEAFDGAQTHYWQTSTNYESDALPTEFYVSKRKVVILWAY